MFTTSDKAIVAAAIPALTTIICYVVLMMWKVEVPPTVQGALSAVLGGIAVWFTNNKGSA